jgi:hypothetical protein
MNTARVMEDGDLRLPPEVASKLNVKPGDSLDVDVDAHGALRLFPKTLAIEDVCGMLRPPTGVHATVEEMDEAVAEAFRRGEL